MSIRVIVEREETAIVVRVSGRLVGAEALAEFLRACGPVSAGLVIDLGDLRFADEAGTRALCSLRDQGVSLSHVPPYISLLLR